MRIASKSYEATYLIAGMLPVDILAMTQTICMRSREASQHKQTIRVWLLAMWQIAWDHANNGCWTHKILDYTKYLYWFGLDELPDYLTCGSAVGEQAFFHLPRFESSRRKLETKIKCRNPPLRPSYKYKMLHWYKG